MIDVIILTNNEEDVLEDAIKSVKGWAKNIIIVDSESTDKTKDIVIRHNAKFYSNKFRDFSDQRNYALTKVSSEWILYLDADERATNEFKEEVSRRIVESNKSGFKVRRKTFYFGKDWKFEDKMLRIIRKSKLKGWEGVVHETAVVDGEIGEIKSPILHFTHRNFEQMVSKTNNWSEYEADLRFNANHPKMKAWRFIRVMFSEFYRSYVKGGGYKNGTYGFLEAVYQSYSIFITYAKLWEKQEK